MPKRKHTQVYEKLGNFEPRKVGSYKDTIVEFAYDGIHQPLDQVPGVGNVNAGILRIIQEEGDFPVTTTSQLMGLYFYTQTACGCVL